MSQAMTVLEEIRRQNERIIELLEALTGRQIGAGGVTHSDGESFAPGTGRLPDFTDSAPTRFVDHTDRVKALRAELAATPGGCPGPTQGETT